MSKKIAMITGAASGIGLATAHSFAASGISLILLDRDPRVEELSNELGRQVPCRALVADLSNMAEVTNVTDVIKSSHDKLDILINNAGISPKKDGRKPLISEISNEDWMRVMTVNLMTPFILYRDLLSLLSVSGSGRVINVGSRAGRAPSPVVGAHYAATKTGLIGLTRVMALEGAQFGITVNCVAPGPVLTGLTSTMTDEVRAKLGATVPLGRYGNPEEIAAVIEFLASEKASFVTGAVYDVNGGTYMP